MSSDQHFNSSSEDIDQFYETNGTTPSSRTTTLSTIVVHSGRFMLVVALLQVHYTIKLNIILLFLNLMIATLVDLNILQSIMIIVGME